MSEVRVSAVFWRRIIETSHKSLHGIYTGQYHITIPESVSNQFLGFLGDLPQFEQGDNGGFIINIPIKRFDGAPPVAPQVLKVRYMGLSSARKDWNFPGQSTGPYPLWAPQRGVPEEFDPIGREYIMLIKDEKGGFHARWQHGTADLPDLLRQRVEQVDFGVWE